MAPARDSQTSAPTPSQQKKQMSLASFFTQKTATATATTPSTSIATDSGTLNTTPAKNQNSGTRTKEALAVPKHSAQATVKKTKRPPPTRLTRESLSEEALCLDKEGNGEEKENGFAATRRAPHGKRDVAGEGSNVDDWEPRPKRARLDEEDEAPGLRATLQKQTSLNGAKVTGRTSRYLFSSSPAEHIDDREDEPESEESRRRKEQLHRRFVQKLGRPDAIAEIKRRNNFVGEETEAVNEDGEAAEDEEAEEESPPKKGGKSRLKGGARANGKLTPMEVQYLDIKRKHLDTVIIFEVGYKFRFFGEDARIASKVLGIVCIPGKFKYDNHPSEAHIDRFASASFPVARLHVHVKRLVSAGHKVGVVRQVETAALKAAGDNKATVFVRKLTNVYTKGTYVDDLEGLEGPVAAPAGAPSTGYLLCLTESNARGYGNDEKVHVGIVAVQPATGDIVYDDFEDGFMRSDIETRLLHIAPCEYLIVGELSDATEKLIKHLSGSKANVFGDQARVERVEKAQTAAAQAYSHVSGFYAGKLSASQNVSGEQKSHVLDQVHQLSQHVTVCLSAMIQHLEEYGLQHIFDLTKNFHPFSARTHMLLNGNTLSSLEIYKDQHDLTEKGSLFWTLDRTRTRFGKRMLRNWVGRPLLDKAKLEDRVCAVEELLKGEGTASVDRIKRMLNNSKSDLEKVLTRIYYRKASRPELLAFLQSLQRVAGEFAYVKKLEDAGFQSNMLNEVVSQLPSVGDDVVAFLDRINLTAAKTDDRYGFFRDEHETDRITEHKLGIAAVEHELNDYRPRAATILGKKNVHYVTVAGIEYLIEVETAGHTLKRVPASWVKVSGTKKLARFHAPEVVKLIRERDLHKESLAAACDDAFSDLLSEVSQLYQPLRDCIQAIAHLDCLVSLAEVAAQPGYCKPTFSSEPCIDIVQGRHPMVEQLLLDAYVPNDTSLCARSPSTHPSSTRDSTRPPSALLITGPNMGGKSSYVRSTALLCIMAQLGSFIPASSATLGLLDGIYTRMGAFDNLLRGESTFMVELGETSSILRQATPRSLVILDELGRGTSTHDGCAIAEAVLRECADRGLMTLFITHYQDLAKLEGRCPGLENVHVKFREADEADRGAGEGEITFLYEVGKGVAHRSYGLNVARLAGLPSGVLEEARGKSAEFEALLATRKALRLARMVGRVCDGNEGAEEMLDSVHELAALL